MGWLLLVAVGVGLCLLLRSDEREKKKDGKRRLTEEQTVPWNVTNDSFPFLSQCLENALCNSMVTGYDFLTETAQSKCIESGCSEQDLFLFQSSIDEVMATAEIETQCSDEICVGTYIYINDGEERTYSEAEAICDEYYGLATIVSEQEFECARNLIIGPAAWTGLQSLDNNDAIFTFLDGTYCPTQYNNKYFDGCVPWEWWQYQKQNGGQRRPRCYHDWNDEGGSKCVNIDNNYIDNDIKCDKTLLAVLCNGRPRVIPAKHDKIMYIENNGKSNNLLNKVIYDPYYQYIIFISIILFIIINNVFICIWCLRKTNIAHTTYNKLKIKHNEKV